MGLDIHKVVLLWYLVNEVINIEGCDRVMHRAMEECMMRSHHNVGASVLFCTAHMYEPPKAQFDGIVINVWKNRKVHSDKKLYVLNFT